MTNATTRITNKFKHFIGRRGFVVKFLKFENENPDMVRFHFMAFTGSEEIAAFCEHLFGPHTTCSAAIQPDFEEKILTSDICYQIHKFKTIDKNIRKTPADDTVSGTK